MHCERTAIATSAIRPHRQVAALLAGVAVALGACEPAAPTFPLRLADGGRPNVVLITVDTLRADHLGAYGYAVPTSPVIDGMAARGVRYAGSVAVAPETAPAVAALLTGLYQHRTRVFFNRNTLPADVLTLAEMLGAAGYETAGIVGNHLVGPKRGFAQGFAHFETFDSRPPWEPWDGLGIDAAIAWLGATPRAPWFLWLHLMDPHGPYVSAPPSWSEGFTYPVGTFGDDAPIPLGQGNFGLDVLPKYQQFPGMTRPSELVRRYDGEIHFTDAQIGRLVEALQARGLTDRTLIVLTADHGESLTEHRELFQHGWFLYDTTLRVPLVFSWEGVLPAGRVVTQQVSTLDLVPTLQEILGIEIPGAHPNLDGRSFAQTLYEDAGLESPPAFAVGPRENHPFAVRWGGWKLIHTPPRWVATAAEPIKGHETAERVELYRLSDDPGETADVAGQHPEVVARLRAKLAAFRATFRMSGVRW